MRPEDLQLYNTIKNNLSAYERANPALASIAAVSRRETLIYQMIDSVRRIRFVHTIRDMNQPIDPVRADPSNSAFDPLRAAILHKRNGNLEEAFWLTFLATHFGKHRNYNWGLTRGTYGGLEQNGIWTWNRIISDVNGFLQWLDDNQALLGERGRFSNHRKYESLKAYAARGTGASIKSYISLIQQNGTHVDFIRNAQAATNGQPTNVFDYLYKQMDAVTTFGRVGKFDYLTMIGKLGLANIHPGIAYLKNATGPLRGARLLFGNDVGAALSVTDLEDRISVLSNYFGGFEFIMQIFEDSLCNWQKSPDVYLSFRG